LLTNISFPWMACVILFDSLRGDHEIDFRRRFLGSRIPVSPLNVPHHNFKSGAVSFTLFCRWKLIFPGRPWSNDLHARRRFPLRWSFQRSRNKLIKWCQLWQLYEGMLVDCFLWFANHNYHRLCHGALISAIAIHLRASV
jgi:hypothetical protein